MFSPLPPAPNGIADYTYEVLLGLSRLFRIHVVVDDETPAPLAPDRVTVLSLIDYECREQEFANFPHVYQIGNNPDHIYMLPVMARNPGLIVLHDPSLHHLLDCLTVSRGDIVGYRHALQAEYGKAGRILGEQFAKYRIREQRMHFDLPMLRGLVGPAQGVIVHSDYAAIKVLAQVPEADVSVVPHHYCPPDESLASARADVRRRLGIAEDEVVFMSLGFVTRAKRIPEVLRALASIKDALPPFRYVIAGEHRPDDVDVASMIAGLGLTAHVLMLGYVESLEFFSLIGAADVVINLRYPVGGETSGSMIRALGGGACVVVVDKGPFAEIPDKAACKLAWGGDFEARLARLLLTLARNPDARRRIGAEARRLVKHANALDRTVGGYAAAIDRAGRRPRTAWGSAVAWHSLPPHHHHRAVREASRRVGAPGLPLWFRSGAVPRCDPPCDVALWGGGARETGLLALLGHRATSRPLSALLDATPNRTTARSLDLAVVMADAEAFEATTAPLTMLSRRLRFGGILVIVVACRPGPRPGALAMRAEGARLLEAFGFRVDEVALEVAPDLDTPIASPPAAAEERCWRAIKVSEFISGDAGPWPAATPSDVPVPSPPAPPS